MGLGAFVAGLGALVASELHWSPPQPINSCPYKKNPVALVEDSRSSSASSKSKPTASPAPTSVSKNVTSDLKTTVMENLARHEGAIPFVYLDSKEKPTLGIGMHVGEKGSNQRKKAEERLKKLGKSKEEIEEIFAEPEDGLKGGNKLVTKSTLPAPGQGTIDKTEMAKLFEEDYEDHRKLVARRINNFDKLAPEAQGVLIEMMFQMGEGSFDKFKGMKKALESDPPDYDKAADEMRYKSVDAKTDSDWYKDTPERCEEKVDKMRSAAKESTAVPANMNVINNSPM